MKFLQKNSLQRNWLGDIRAMTLPELIVATGLLVLIVTGLILSYLRAIELQEVAQSTSIATKAALSRLEYIRSKSFNQIESSYDFNAFAVNGLTAEGVTYVDVEDEDYLLDVTASVTWKQRSGRVYGEDKDLDGVIDSGEDANANGKLNGGVEIVTKIFKK